MFKGLGYVAGRHLVRTIQPVKKKKHADFAPKAIVPKSNKEFTVIILLYAFTHENNILGHKPAVQGKAFSRWATSLLSIFSDAMSSLSCDAMTLVGRLCIVS